MTVFEVTEQARAEVEKKRKRAQQEQESDSGGTGAHAMAEGHQEYHERRKREEEEALKAARHPETGRFIADQRHPILTDGHAADSPGNIPATPRPATSWPGTAAHTAAAMNTSFTQVGDRQAPSPLNQTTVSDQRGADHPERLMHPGTVPLAHVDLTAANPFNPQTTPRQVPFHTAPINAGGNQ